MKEKTSRNHYNIVVVGAGSSGKTCIIHKFMFDRFYEEYEPTTGERLSKTFTINDLEYRLDILDTAGQEVRSYYEAADGFLIVYSITQPATIAAARMFYQQIMDIKGRSADVPFVLVGNKLDLERMRSIGKGDGATFANQIHSPFFETSAKDGTNVDSAFYELVRQIRQRKLNIKKQEMCKCLIS